MSCTSAKASAKSSFKSKRMRHSPRNLRHFQSMSQTVTEMIRKSSSKNLRLSLKPPKSPRMHDAIPVPRIFIPVRMRSLRKSPPPSMPHIHGISRRNHAAIL